MAATLETPTTFHEREADLLIERKEMVADGVVALTLTDPSGGAARMEPRRAH